MSYIRTEEIKEKQRKKMLEKVKEYDWVEIDRKRKATIVERGVKSGRRKGEGPKKTGKFKNCVVCNSEFWVTLCRESRRTCSRVCLFKDPEYLTKLKVPKPGNGPKLKESTPAYKRYSNKVHFLTRIVYKENHELINPDNHPRTLCGVEGGWQLDHKISIRCGFDNGIPPEQIAAVENLQMLPWMDNLLKG